MGKQVAGELKTIHVGRRKFCTPDETLTVRDVLTRAGLDHRTHYLNEILADGSRLTHRNRNATLVARHHRRFVAVKSG